MPPTLFRFRTQCVLYLKCMYTEMLFAYIRNLANIYSLPEIRKHNIFPMLWLAFVVYSVHVLILLMLSLTIQIDAFSNHSYITDNHFLSTTTAHLWKIVCVCVRPGLLLQSTYFGDKSFFLNRDALGRYIFVGRYPWFFAFFVWEGLLWRLSRGCWWHEWIAGPKPEGQCVWRCSNLWHDVPNFVRKFRLTPILKLKPIFAKNYGK